MSEYDNQAPDAGLRLVPELHQPRLVDGLLEWFADDFVEKVLFGLVAFVSDGGKTDDPSIPTLTVSIRHRGAHAT